MGQRWRDYELIDTLTPNQTWRARDPAGREVVLKKLNPQCLVGRQLHPNIRSRLQRLSELPLLAAANIIGVERWDDDPHKRTMLISEYVAGRSLEQSSNPERRAFVRQLRSQVLAMHQFGLIHGAIHERNVIITPDRKVMLIDPSPLLHDDPASDLRALDKLAGPTTTAVEPAGESRASVEISTHPRQRMIVAAVALLCSAGAAGFLIFLKFGR